MINRYPGILALQSLKFQLHFVHVFSCIWYMLSVLFCLGQYLGRISFTLTKEFVRSLSGAYDSF